MNQPLATKLSTLTKTTGLTGTCPAVPLEVSSKVALLTGCKDRPYALGFAIALAAKGVLVDFLGSDELDAPELRSNPRIRFINLRGDQNPRAGLFQKITRVLIYYARLCNYALCSDAQIFHVLWNDKLELFERTFLKLFYRVLGRRLVFTAHNINVAKRDGNDSWLNRCTLKMQYHLAHHIFVHTDRMKTELIEDFKVRSGRISVIPLGLNETAPNTNLGREDARKALGLEPGHQTMLFFGRITPYKGLEYLVEALRLVLAKQPAYKLIIAGPIKNDLDYWHQIQQAIKLARVGESIINRVGFVPDEQVEIFFKAADVLMLPYSHIFQSGLLSLGYSFGLPIIAADVGSLKEDIEEGEMGYVCRPRDPVDLARAIEQYFGSDLCRDLPRRRALIRAYADERFSWEKVMRITNSVYSNLLS